MNQHVESYQTAESAGALNLQSPELWKTNIYATQSVAFLL